MVTLYTVCARSIIALTVQTYRASVQLPDRYVYPHDSLAACATLAVRLPTQDALREYLENPEMRFAIITRRYGVSVAWDTALVDVEGSKSKIMRKWLSEPSPVVLHFAWNVVDGCSPTFSPFKRFELTPSGQQSIDELKRTVERSDIQIVTMMRKSLGGGAEINSPPTVTTVSLASRHNMSIRLELFVQERLWRTLSVEHQQHCLACVRKVEGDVLAQLPAWNTGQKHSFCLINTRDSYRHELNSVCTRLQLCGGRTITRTGGAVPSSTPAWFSFRFNDC